MHSEEAVASAGPRLDPAFPAAHVRPIAGWLNDPNGPVRWKDRYHLFFQYNPDSPTHRDICWGHASSPDLADWRIEGPALVPSPGGPDSHGCWSGCIVDDAGTATAVYTGVTAHETDMAASASICLAYAADDDLQDWRKDPLPVAHPPQEMSLLGYRDPFVFMHEGHRYAIVGAGAAPGGAATVFVYGCDDLRNWVYLGVLLDTTHPVASEHAAADIWECPQLARVGSQWVLILSLWHAQTLGRVAYLLGDLVLRDGAPRFVPTGGGLADAGRDFYAPAVLNEPHRSLVWGWSWEERPETEVLGSGWAGVLTQPRVLELQDGVLSSQPASEVTRLRSIAGETSVVLTPADATVELPVGAVELAIGLPPDGGGPVTLTLSGLGTTCDIDVVPREGRIRLRHHHAGSPRSGWPTESTYAAASGMPLRLVLDGDLLELYPYGGTTFTERLRAPEDGVWRLTAQGGPDARTSATIWSLTGFSD